MIEVNEESRIEMFRYLTVLRDEKLQSYRIKVLRKRFSLRKTAVYYRFRHVF